MLGNGRGRLEGLYLSPEKEGGKPRASARGRGRDASGESRGYLEEPQVEQGEADSHQKPGEAG